MEDSNAEKWDDHQKKKFFIINSLKFMKILGDCDIIFVMKVTQNGGQWELCTFAPLWVLTTLCVVTMGLEAV